jgi:iron complex outermembrane recepter protein
MVCKRGTDVMKKIPPGIIRILLMCVIGAPLSVNAQDLEMQKLKALSIRQLMDVEVTSVSKRSEKITETPSAIQVITKEDIRYSGATNVPELLRLATNLQVAQVNASQWAISARGFNNVLSNKLLVLIDGRVVYTPMYAGVFWDVQNLLLDDIERIEVISGPGGTLWGANAVNGVINIITKSSQDTKGLYIEAATGTELRALGSIRYGGKISENLTYRIYSTGFKRDNTIFSPDSIEARDSWQLAQGGVRFDWNPSTKNTVSFISNLYEGRPDPDGGKPVVASGGNGLLRWNHTHSDRSSLQVQTFYDRTWRDFRNGFAEELNTYDIEAQHRLSIGRRHQIVYGLGTRVMRHNVNNLELFAFQPAEKTLNLSNLFLQDELSLIDEKLRLTLGMKVEHNSYTKFQYLPNARLAWMLTQSQTIWTAVSRAVRNPSRIDREFYLYLAPGIPFIQGNDAKSETLTAYELGWKSQASEKLFVSLSTFYNVYDNLRSVEPGPPPLMFPVTFGNGVKGNTYGAELSFTYQMTSTWKLRGGYTFVEKDLKVKPDSQDQNNATAESNDPKHQLLIQSTLRANDRLNVGVVARYVDELPQPTVPAYVGLDLQIALNVSKKIELIVTGQNLLQKSHTEFIPASPAAKDIQRSLYGKLICRF